MKNNCKDWHVLYVKPRYEKKVYDSLLESSLEAFLPLVETIRVWSDRKKNISKPLFPSYIFVKIHSLMDLHRVLSIDGVYTFIRFGSEYAKIKDEEINIIKCLLGLKEIRDIDTYTDLPNVGDIKTISYGALSGLKCEILNINNKNKIVVRINSIHQIISATIPLNYLSKISKDI